MTNKKPYTAPRLTHFGTISNVTMSCSTEDDWSSDDDSSDDDCDWPDRNVRFWED